ncbi:MAG TPA: hypothetical protein VJ180_08050 [Pyrinomonadaceae bacterium]|nr:hypothetical protein [Pyrinomonadaceae bacterium]
MTRLSSWKPERGTSAFGERVRLCREYFGRERIKGSHHIFKTPWPGDPRINLQEVRGKAKSYQVDQVIAALERLKETGEGLGMKAHSLKRGD